MAAPVSPGSRLLAAQPAQAGWLSRFNAQLARNACDYDALRGILNGEIGQRTQTLRTLQSQAARAGLSAANLAIVNADFAALLADLQSLQSRVDAEATVAGFQTERDALAAQDRMLSTVSSWVQVLRGVGAIASQVGPLTTFENQLEASLAAAPPSFWKNRAQALVNQLQTYLSRGQDAVGSALVTLMGVSVAGLETGSARKAISAAQRDSFAASWKFFNAWWSGLLARYLLGH
jgi:hypothetical protein